MYRKSINNLLHLQILGDQVVQIQRPIDKKVVLFYNDKNSLFEVDEGMCVICNVLLFKQQFFKAFGELLSFAKCEK